MKETEKKAIQESNRILGLDMDLTVKEYADFLKDGEALLAAGFSDADQHRIEDAYSVLFAAIKNNA